MSDYEGADDTSIVDAEVEDVTGTALAVPTGTEVEPSDVVDAELVEDDVPPDEIVVGGVAIGEVGRAYPAHGPVTSDVSAAATTGQGTSNGGFKWSKPERGGGGGGGGGGAKPKRKPFGRRGSRGSGGSGGGYHFNLIGSLFPNAAVIKTGAIASGNASNNAPSVVSTGRPARKSRPTRRK